MRRSRVTSRLLAPSHLVDLEEGLNGLGFGVGVDDRLEPSPLGIKLHLGRHCIFGEGRAGLNKDCAGWIVYECLLNRAIRCIWNGIVRGFYPGKSCASNRPAVVGGDCMSTAGRRAL